MGARAGESHGLRRGTPLEIAASVALLGTIAAAPWTVTPINDAAAAALEFGLCGGIAAWTIALMRQRRMPYISKMLGATAGALLAWGTLLTLNAHTAYDTSSRSFVHTHDLVSWLPGAVDRATAARTLFATATVLLAVLVLVDLSHKQRFRTTALWSLAVNGAAVGAIGALERIGIANEFHHDDHSGGTPFAAFGYHGNAAAYLDLALPAALMLAIGGARSRTARVFAALLAAMILTGSATQASKAGLLLAIATVLVFSVAAARGLDRHPRTSRDRHRRIARRAALATLIATVAFTGALASHRRWAELPDELGPPNGRIQIWHVALEVWKDHPVGGGGPGSFKLLIPIVAATHVRTLFASWIVTAYRPGRPVTIWMYAHDDPLQVLAEWGVVGALLIGGLMAWPVVCGARTALRDRNADLARIAGLVALGTLYVHALIDFPLQIISVQLAAGVWAAILIAGARRATREKDQMSA